MSIPSVGWNIFLNNISNIMYDWGTWSRITMSVSSWRWHATFSLCFSETVRSATRVCFTWLSPRSSIKASICNEVYYSPWWICYQYLTLPLVSLPLVRVPGSLIKEWKSIVCLTLMSVVKLMFLSTRDTLSDSLAGWTLNHVFVWRKYKQSLSYLFPLIRMSPLYFVPRPPCLFAIMLHKVVPSSPEHRNISLQMRFLLQHGYRNSYLSLHDISIINSALVNKPHWCTSITRLI